MPKVFVPEAFADLFSSAFDTQERDTLKEALSKATEAFPEGSLRWENASSALRRVDTLLAGSKFANSTSKERVLGVLGDAVDLLDDAGAEFLAEELQELVSEIESIEVAG